jgi:hypothetical protein
MPNTNISPPIVCNCTPYGVLHQATCPVGQLQLEMAVRERLGLDVAAGYVSFSSGYLRRVDREERKALNGRRYLRRFVRPQVERLRR